MLGEGILKGLAETAKNFAGSFVDKERLTTVEYPEERLPLPEAARNFPFLVYDGGDWEKGLRCVACQICEKECPPKCIYIEKSKDKKPDFVGKMQIYPAKFDIDISVCMSCQICVEVCPFEAIKMNHEFELSTDDRFGTLLLDRKELAKPNEYYHQIHPTEAALVDAKLAEEKAKAEAKAKVDAANKAKAAAPNTAERPGAPVAPAKAPAVGAGAQTAAAAKSREMEIGEVPQAQAGDPKATADPSTAATGAASAQDDKENGSGAIGKSAASLSNGIDSAPSATPRKEGGN